MSEKCHQQTSTSPPIQSIRQASQIPGSCGCPCAINCSHHTPADPSTLRARPRIRVNRNRSAMSGCQVARTSHGPDASSSRQSPPSACPSFHNNSSAATGLRKTVPLLHGRQHHALLRPRFTLRRKLPLNPKMDPARPHPNRVERSTPHRRTRNWSRSASSLMTVCSKTGTIHTLILPVTPRFTPRPAHR